MTRHRTPLAATAALALALATSGPLAAQTESPAPAASPATTQATEAPGATGSPGATGVPDAVAAADIVVTGVEYAFLDLPTSVPAGTSLGLTNAGAEVHELVLVRIADDVTASVQELLEMEGDPIEAGMVEMIGEEPLIAEPGDTAEGTRTVEQEGRYVAICFIPQGLTDLDVIMGLDPQADPTTLPEEVQALLANPPHFALGMVQEFTVTAAGSTPGPLSGPAAPGSPAAQGSPGAEPMPETSPATEPMPEASPAG